MVDFGDLNRKSVFEETKWLGYLICCGEGIGKCDMSHLILSDVKELCLHTQAGQVEFCGDQGLCHNVSTCVCITQHVAIPPAKDTHLCVICNKPMTAKRTDG